MDRILIYGKNSVLEGVKTSGLSKLYVQRSKIKDKKLQLILNTAEKKKIKCELLSDDEFVKFVRINFPDTHPNHQCIFGNLLLDSTKRFYSIKDFFSKGNPVEPYTFVILDSITDIHNFGAILRSCEVFNATGVIYSKRHTAPINATTFKTSSGAINYVNLIEVTNIARAIKELREYSVWNYGTMVDGGKPIYSLDLTGNVGIVFGSERKGLRRLVSEYCDDRIYIPQHGKMDSLNVSVACGVVLYEVQRQRT